MIRKIFLVGMLISVITVGIIAEEVLYSGELGGKGRSRALRGSWEIVQQEDGARVLVLGEDFRARSGPDLKVFFSKLPLERIHDRNAGSRSHAIKIGRLKSSRGVQEYPLPKSLDLSVYKTWIVHCEAYSHFWDGATLVDLEDDAEDDTEGEKENKIESDDVSAE